MCERPSAAPRHSLATRILECFMDTAFWRNESDKDLVSGNVLGVLFGLFSDTRRLWMHCCCSLGHERFSAPLRERFFGLVTFPKSCLASSVLYNVCGYFFLPNGDMNVFLGREGRYFWFGNVS